ncbi:S1 family peptidase [Streptomyces sp. NBC_01198]|uniref:S1 family peptidase n=1 Tax=Streptomyces sp. NBC_01198 TaxID=2903769 RepID=UPI002E0E4995|nr:S1 family peptidase [Streptomyces sp. NBC_01198]
MHGSGTGTRVALIGRILATATLVAGALMVAPAAKAHAASPADTDGVPVAGGPSGDATQAVADALGDTHTAGVYLDRASRRMAVAVTDKASAAAVRAAGAETRLVTYDTAYLSSIQTMLDDTFTTPGTSWGIDVLANKVAVTADSTVSDADYTALQEAIAPYGDAATIAREAGTIGSTAATTMAGGWYVDTPHGYCTWGFSVRVKNQPNIQGFLTAGHCTVEARDAGYTYWQNANDQYLGYTAGGAFPGHDFGWVRKDTTTVTFNGGVALNTSGGIQDINASRDSKLYETACSFGATSHFGCGLVGAKNQTVNFPLGQVKGLDVLAMDRDYGDSGGPLFVGKDALGILSGSNTDGLAYYQPVKAALAWYGLEVY